MVWCEPEEVANFVFNIVRATFHWEFSMRFINSSRSLTNRAEHLVFAFVSAFHESLSILVSCVVEVSMFMWAP